MKHDPKLGSFHRLGNRKAVKCRIRSVKCNNEKVNRYLSEHDLVSAVIMHQFIMKAQLGIKAVDTVADKDAVGIVDLFIHEDGHQMSSAGAWVVQRKGFFAYRTQDLENIALFQVDVIGYPAFHSIYGAECHQPCLIPFPHL